MDPVALRLGNLSQRNVQNEYGRQEVDYLKLLGHLSLYQQSLNSIAGRDQGPEPKNQAVRPRTLPADPVEERDISSRSARPCLLRITNPIRAITRAEDGEGEEERGDEGEQDEGNISDTSSEDFESEEEDSSSENDWHYSICVEEVEGLEEGWDNSPSKEIAHQDLEGCMRAGLLDDEDGPDLLPQRHGWRYLPFVEPGETNGTIAAAQSRA